MVHSWTPEDRTVLCLIERLYSSKDFAYLFNYLCNHNASSSNRSWVKTGTLQSQWQGMKRDGAKGHDILHKMESVSDQELKQEYHGTVEVIQKAADLLGIRERRGIDRNLLRGFRVVNFPRRLQKKKRRRSPSASETVITDVSFAASEDEATTLKSGIERFLYDKGQHQPQVEPILWRTVPDFRERLEVFPLRPRSHITHNWKNESVESHPLLLFRATTSISSFRARRFQDITKPIPRPPDFKSAKWYKEAMPHLKQDESYPSPFISLAQACSNATGRVEIAHAKHKDQNSYLVIFDFNDLQRDAESRFGPNTGPYLVREMFSKEQVSTLPKAYKGSGEWFCFGLIGSQPIATIDGGQIFTLVNALRYLKVGDVTAIPDIVRVLKDVPGFWREAVACRFLTAYCGKTPYASTKSQHYEHLMCRIYEGDLVSSQSGRGQCFVLNSAPAAVSQYYKATDRQNDEDEEDEEEDEDDENDEDEANETSIQRPSNSRLIVRVPRLQRDNSSIKDSQDAKAVTNLNSIRWTTAKNLNVVHVAEKTTKYTRSLRDALAHTRGPGSLQLDFNRDLRTPLWSSDSETEADQSAQATPTPAGRSRNNTRAGDLDTIKASRYASTHSESLDGDTNDSDNDWDLVEADLAQSFAEEFPFAVAKFRRFNHSRQLQNPTEIHSSMPIQSIESDSADDGFENLSQELLAHAYAPTPTPVPFTIPNITRENALSAGLNNSTDKVAETSTMPKFPVNEYGRRVNLLSDPTKPVTSLTSRSTTYIDLVSKNGNDSEEDEDVIMGTSRRNHVRLPLRSLSIRRKSVIYID